MWLFSLCISIVISNVASSCLEGKSCTLSSGEAGMCFGSVCLTQIEEETRENLTFKITVRYPEEKLYSSSTGMFIRGNGLGLRWDKGTKLLKTSENNWEITIKYKSYNNRPVDYIPGSTLQYRLFIDDNMDMLGANFAISFPVSRTSSYFDEKTEFVVYPWFNENIGSLQTFVINSTYIGKTRNLTIYTPPSFTENTLKTYPTFFVFDLNMEHATFFKQNIEQPILRSLSEEYILVGFGDYQDDENERTHILSYVPVPFMACKSGTYANFCDGCIPANVTNAEYLKHLTETCGKQTIIPGMGDATLDFLTLEALPKAETILMNRIERDRLGIMGYSLGGLMSCYAAWTRPNVFAFAACQSATFWWPNSIRSVQEPLFHFINTTLKDSSFAVNRTDQKFYIDAGGENNAPYNVAQAAVEVGLVISSFEHYKLDTNVWVHVHPYKAHNLKEWARRMGQALTTLLPADGETNIPMQVTSQASVSNGCLLSLLLICVLKYVLKVM